MGMGDKERGRFSCRRKTEAVLRVLRGEDLLWVRIFETVEEVRLVLLAFKERYNREWLTERYQYSTPQQTRQKLLACQVAVAWQIRGGETDSSRGVDFALRPSARPSRNHGFKQAG